MTIHKSLKMISNHLYDIENKGATEITTSDIEEVVLRTNDNVKAGKISGSYANKILRVMSNTLKFAIEQKYRTSDIRLDNIIYFKKNVRDDVV